MSITAKFREMNGRVRRLAAYDTAYRRLHAVYKSLGKNWKAQYYHRKYHVTPVVEGLVLLDSFWGRMVGCNPYALYLEMKKDPRCATFRYVWVCNDKSSIPADVQSDPDTRFVAYQSIAYQKAMLQAQYLVGNCNFPVHFVKKPDQIYINTWHGTPIKHIGRDAEDDFVPSANTQRNYLASDYILSYSSAMTHRTVSAYGASIAQDRVYEIGTPRIDLTLSTSRDDIRQTLGVESDKDILLYAPTWRGTFSAQNHGLKSQINTIKAILAQFADSHEVFVSVHHITAQALATANVQFRVIPANLPINKILAGTDLLISDYSSITVDYLCLDRPIALFCPDYEDYTASQGLHDDLRALPVAFCRTMPELISAVAAQKRPSDFSSYSQFKELLFPLEDGAASRRSLDIVLSETPATDYPRSGRKRILFYAGGLMPNGITSSIIALSNLVDHDKYELSVVFDAVSADKDLNRLINIEKLHSRCHLITRAGVTTYTPAERIAYQDFCRAGRFLNDDDKALVEALFDREARRIFGVQSFDVAIDFSGYGPFWSMVISKVKADRHLTYQHNDMYREANNPNEARSFPDLPAVFSLYDRYDGVVSVTAEMVPVNRKNLAKYYTEATAFLSAENVVDGDRILRLAKVPLSLVAPQVESIVEKTDLYLFCCVARLSPEKNHSRLLAAFALVRKENPDCALLIIGNGKILTQLRKEAQRLGVFDYVIFLGHCENPYPIIHACDCKVLASQYEGQGIVLLEALTLGVRCIATDNPAVRSVLKDGVGTLVPQDTKALAAAMLAASLEKDPVPVSFDTAAYAASAREQFYKCVE